MGSSCLVWSLPSQKSSLHFEGDLYLMPYDEILQRRFLLHFQVPFGSFLSVAANKTLSVAVRVLCSCAH